jgi:thymidylate synthase
MIYTRPSIWLEYNENGKNDFICTNSVTYYVRDNKLHAVVQMRSNDVVFGYKNDYAWQKYILDSLVKDLSGISKVNYEAGDIIWQVQNLHVYGRHFDLVK